MRTPEVTIAILLASGVAVCFVLAAANVAPRNVLTGKKAFEDASKVQPGTFRKITASDLPQPYATSSASNTLKIIPRPADAWPKAPLGFKVELYTTGLNFPRLIRRAPNGDMFLADAPNHSRNNSGAIKVLRGITKDGKPEKISTFASGLNTPFGIAFYPPGPNPQWVYIASTTSVIRLPYKNDDLEATGAAQTIIEGLPLGGHATRDLAFSADGKRLFVAVGSLANVDDADSIPAETRRANILEYTPDGQFVKVYASGIRNPVGIAVNPLTGELWCSVNERDALGDNLVPDYITHLQEGGFYGWPYYYSGGNQDPRLEGKHPELKDHVIVPDILLQAHSASLEMVFYDGKQFPEEYRGDIFASEHGSWNKATPAGYELVRVPLAKGRSSGEYESFLTGFITGNGEAAWGRPVGVAVAPDGSLMVTDDASKSIWRVFYAGHSGK
jgi:glucose/arabinose dehydrogenase